MRLSSRLYTREQIRFMIELAFVSFGSQVGNLLPCKWLDGTKESEKRFKRDLKEFKQNYDFGQLLNTSIDYLSWNLSILVAQITDDGMGNCDAMTYYDIETKLTDWVLARYAGERGTIVDKDDSTRGKVDDLDWEEITDGWMKEVCKDYPELVKL